MVDPGIIGAFWDKGEMWAYLFEFAHGSPRRVHQYV